MKTQDAKLKPNIVLVDQIDRYATALLEASNAATFEDREAVLQAVTKWIGVRDKLLAVESLDGSGLSTYRNQIEGSRDRTESGRASGTPVTAVSKPRRTSAADIIGPDHVGERLGEIAERLPAIHASRDRRSRASSIGTDNLAVERGGGAGNGLSGHGKSLDDDDRDPGSI